MSRETAPLLPRAQTDQAVSRENRTRNFVVGVVVAVVFLLCLLGAMRIYHSRSDHLVKLIPFSSVSHPEPPTTLWGNVVKPYPTGAFWTNLALGKGDGPIGVYPYAVKCTEKGVVVSYGAYTRHVTQISMFDDYVEDLRLSSVEPYKDRSISANDFVSVTMNYDTTEGGGFKTPLVKGSPFVTVVYTSSTPVVSSELMHFYSIEKKSLKGLNGIVYHIILGNWMNWLVYCSEDVEFHQVGDTLLANRPINGYVRVAYVPPFSESAFNTYIKYVAKYPTGGSFTYAADSENNAVLNFHFTTAGSGSLLMLALPHHNQTLISPAVTTEQIQVQSSLSPIYCIKGKMRAIVGDTWRMKYSLPKVW